MPSRDRSRERKKGSRSSKERKSKRSKTERSRERSKRLRKKTLNGKSKKYKKKQRRRKVRFVRSEKLFEINYFRKLDKPNAEALTEEKIAKMKDRLIHESFYGSASVSASGSVVSSVEQSIIDRRDEKKLNMMKETISWTKPKSVFRGGKDSRAFGNNSMERTLHNERISNKIACYYSRDYQIPDKPKKNTFSGSFGDPDHHEIIIELEEFREIDGSENQSMEEEEIPDYSTNKEILEYNKKQLKKKPSRSVLRKINLESDSESIYTDSEEEDIDQDEEINILPRILGVLGINVRRQRRFMTSVKRSIESKTSKEKKSVNDNVNWMKIFHDSITHVQTINANLNKMVGTNPDRTLLGPISRSNKKKFNPKRKTVPCVWYHGEVGCHRGTNCDFIHDPRYKGRKVPNMKNYVRPIHQLSKRPENNLFNMMVYKKATNTNEVPQRTAQPQYNSNRGGNNFQQSHHQSQGGGQQIPQNNSGFHQNYQPQQKMGMNGFMGIVKTHGSKNRYYKPQYPQGGGGGGHKTNNQQQYHSNYEYGNSNQFQNYSGQPSQFNSRRGNYGGFPPGGRPNNVGNRQFHHQNFNNSVKQQIFNSQSNGVKQNQR